MLAGARISKPVVSTKGLCTETNASSVAVLSSNVAASQHTLVPVVFLLGMDYGH